MIFPTVAFKREGGNMAILKILFVASTLLFAFDPIGKTLPVGFELLEARNLEAETYDKVRRKAVELIEKALKSNNNNLNEYAISYGKEVVRELNMSRFAISKNEQSEKFCEDASFFVMPSHPNVIFVCNVSRNALRSGSFRNFMISVQQFIHEGSHLVDHRRNNFANIKGDECQPTYFELTIMEVNLGKQNIPTMGNRDSYREQCKFAEYETVPSDEQRREK